MEIVRIKNGFLLAEGEPSNWFFCSNLAELHRELEFMIGGEPLPPLPEPPKPPAKAPDMGVRQFSDED